MVENPENRERLLDVWLGLTGQGPLPRGPLILPVLSGSMRPVIEVGARILIQPATGAGCRIGDVAVYQEEDRLVAHRVLWRCGGRAFLKGDANNFGHWIDSHRLKGVVREVLPAEDLARTFPGKDPYSVAAAARSRRQYLRNVVLAGPRRLKAMLTGQGPGNGTDT